LALPHCRIPSFLTAASELIDEAIDLAFRSLTGVSFDDAIGWLVDNLLSKFNVDIDIEARFDAVIPDIDDFLGKYTEKIEAAVKEAAEPFASQVNKLMDTVSQALDFE
jgi:hypothetical protein